MKVEEPVTVEELQEIIKGYEEIITSLLSNSIVPYFISGEIGERDEFGMPKMLMVCPAVGIHGHAVYTKTAEYRAPGW